MRLKDVYDSRVMVSTFCANSQYLISTFTQCFSKEKIMNTHFRDNRGFTLVELAVVMVIIGLLIGGILKGQEMIENARVNATISQIKAVDAASSTFQDMYDALAGDMIDASTRLPGIANNGNGNNQLDNAPFIDPAAGSETILFFAHINAADLLVGSPTTDGMAADIRGSEITVGQLAATGNLGMSTTARAGRYAVVAIEGNAAASGLIQLQAGRIDRKLDDGIPTTGSVVADNVAACGGATGYLEASGTLDCSIAARIN
ncbi:MAG: prepilin-type N-terminal cleavage/methylation domain-containing protein [Alphaproteobacteria bacterium]|nr:prepilin-type N-terminal cleavage/methylation domain-containing protein [Alphaproteobacteria bacterium]